MFSNVPCFSSCKVGKQAARTARGTGAWRTVAPGQAWGQTEEYESMTCLQVGQIVDADFEDHDTEHPKACLSRSFHL